MSVEPVIIGRATLYCGDARHILPSLFADAVVTDPPYGIGEDGGKHRLPRNRLSHRVLPKLGWDKVAPDAEMFALLLAAAPLHVIWGGNYFTDNLPVSRGWLYWNKLMGGDFSDGELAWTNMDRPLRSIAVCNKMGGKEHPTQKPLEVMRWCIEQLPEDCDEILDPFMGSGTTGVAALQMGRAFTGIEREPRYFEIACRRLREANGDDCGPLFGEAA